ncbi:hypothetical protein [Sphingomonas sp. Sph1(2015)]|uniref:hypothetical protein n=1 Tax=Sphingomonas sp. Sph1(2015) TaxID=1628084 RepID=UPI0009786E74|nr:hypothetical protein [Sphingomonas sp. Sph1(2015)]
MMPMTDHATLGCPAPLQIDGKAFFSSQRQVDQFLALNTHSTSWRPAGAKLAGLVDAMSAGMAADCPQRSDLSRTTRAIAALHSLAEHALASGLDESAVNFYARAFAHLRALAAAGSQTADRQITEWSGVLEGEGILPDVIAAADRIANDEAH